MEKSFRAFAQLSTGGILVNGDDDNTMETVKGLDVVTFGLNAGNRIQAVNVSEDWRSFDVLCDGTVYCHLDLAVYGRHNAVNALAAAGTAWMMGIPGDAVVSGLATFRGAGRRLEFKGTYNGADVYDDYAHHPGELAATINAVRTMGYKRVIFAFQPHTYPRTKALFDDVVEELKKPDIVVLHNLHGNFINLPLLLKYLAKHDIATVAVLHDCWFYTGKCCHYVVQNCFKWKETCNNCPSLKKHNPSWFFDRTTKMHADKVKLFNSIPRLAVVGVSDWIVNEAKQSPVFANAKNIKRIYNWVDTEVFSPVNFDDLKSSLGLVDKKVILSVAYGWSKDKGLDIITQISKDLNSDEKIVLVGDINEDVSINENIIHISTTISN